MITDMMPISSEKHPPIESFCVNYKSMKTNSHMVYLFVPTIWYEITLVSIKTSCNACMCVDIKLQIKIQHRSKFCLSCCVFINAQIGEFTLPPDFTPHAIVFLVTENRLRFSRVYRNYSVNLRNKEIKR